ncbi:MAG TPA: class I SAM-dependent methyltransferase [Candidatus Acidoferrales bacterium]|nr:class I SAM-dependent methyltransferase [Candidatus Acidoferrales bacterium]
MTIAMPAVDPKQRFSNRVEDYVRYRPGYPRAILDVLRDECGLTPESVVTDIGSGTGLFAELFLENGNVVYGVEPNAAMRDAGEQQLEKHRHFCSVAGSAEATTLADASVDFVVAGQAFHWFDRAAARREFARILKPQGWVALVWNERAVGATPFMTEYERLLQRHGTGYSTIQHVYSEQAELEDFYGSGEVRTREFENQQHVDWEGLRGRLMSASYAPRPGDPKHEPMIRDLERLFAAHQSGGRVMILYRARIYWGRLGPSAGRKGG